MTTTPQRFAPAYLPPVCADCGHLLSKLERAACRCCGAPRAGYVAPPPEPAAWVSFQEAATLCGRPWSEMVAIVTRHGVPRARHEGQYRIATRELVEALAMEGAA
jgi:predicted amidophosphoribosyltransferase